jgi:zinc carboxypeptidase
VKLTKPFIFFSILLLSMNTNAGQSGLQSRAERTSYEETSRYADVMEFIAGLQKINPTVRLETFGITNEGRALPLVILSKPAISSPAQAAQSGKPVVFIMANIHAGEVEGKEAAQHLMRDVVSGSLSGLLDRVILLVAPIYNADGNEKIDINNRTAQNGPKGGVGTRENAKQMDLNRDFMKVESPGARGLIENVFNRWDPHVVIDLHTTNGSYHGYALTFSPCLNPNADSKVVSFARDKILPEAARSLRDHYKYNTYFYGNFVDDKSPTRELAPDGSTDPKAWATFDHRPRFGNNYIGLRNRIAILSEAYSYIDFRSRVDVTEKFVQAVLNYVADHSAEVLKVIKEADLRAVETGATAGNEEGFGISFELKATPKPVEILVGSVTKIVDPRTNKPRFQAASEARRVRMTEYGEFQPTRRIKPPFAYILKPEQKRLVELLQAHGVVVEATLKDETLEIQKYSITDVARAQRVFQGHRETKLSIASAEAEERFPAGSYVVSMLQPKAALIFYLLEPESDDGLVNWNYLDSELDAASKSGEKQIYPIYRLKRKPQFPRQIVR